MMQTRLGRENLCRAENLRFEVAAELARRLNGYQTGRAEA
jgi:hypothetical protein